MVSWPFWPRGRLLGPKAPISPKRTNFHENVWFGSRNHHFHEIPPFCGKRAKSLWTLALATFYALKRNARLVFWAPGPQKCTFGPQSRLFTSNRTFGTKSAFSVKVTFGPKRRFGWFGWEMDKFRVGIHMVSSILGFLVFPWCRKVIFMEFH